MSDLVLLALADGLARIRVTATPGFYVRSLAHDLGARLGCGAHLEALRRTRAGHFTLDDAVPLDVVEAEGAAAVVRLIPLDSLLPDLPAVCLNDRGVRRASHGNAVSFEDFEHPDHGITVATDTAPVRLTTVSGTLLAIASPAPGGFLRPAIVLV